MTAHYIVTNKQGNVTLVHKWTSAKEAAETADRHSSPLIHVILQHHNGSGLLQDREEGVCRCLDEDGNRLPVDRIAEELRNWCLVRGVKEEPCDD